MHPWRLRASPLHKHHTGQAVRPNAGGLQRVAPTSLRVSTVSQILPTSLQTAGLRCSLPATHPEETGAQMPETLLASRGLDRPGEGRRAHAPWAGSLRTRMAQARCPGVPQLLYGHHVAPPLHRGPQGGRQQRGKWEPGGSGFWACSCWGVKHLIVGVLPQAGGQFFATEEQGWQGWGTQGSSTTAMRRQHQAWSSWK